MIHFAVNSRCLSGQLSGVQRYTLEILRHFPQLSRLAPSRGTQGIAGHVWEQFTLPRILRGRVLWSPANTGPLSITRQVVSIHDTAPLDHPEWFNRKFAAWYRFLIPRLVGKAKNIIAVSEYTKHRLVENTGVDPDKIEVILNGVDSRFTPEKCIRSDTERTALGIPSSTYILTVGSVEPRKNLMRLLEAWEVIHRQIPDDIWLVICGGIGSRQVFRNGGFDTIPPRVHFTGRVEDSLLPALYAGALVFAYLSEYEGFGLPPLEAMASGVPVITANCTAIPEVVGDAAIMVDPFDTDAIAESLMMLTTDGDLRSNLRKKGLGRACQFSWSETARRTLALIHRTGSD